MQIGLLQQPAELLVDCKSNAIEHGRHWPLPTLPHQVLACPRGADATCPCAQIGEGDDRRGQEPSAGKRRDDRA